MDARKRNAIIAAVNAAKSSEFKVTAIKVELEASLGRRGDFNSTDYCHAYMLERMVGLGLATENADEEYYDDLSDRYEWAGPLVFSRFYNDGSVDSEFTFTIKLDDPENIFLIPKIITIFNELAEDNGGGVDVRGAGMHTALINDRNGMYPVSISNTQFERYENFARSMPLLMPALYFLATSNDTSRGLGYRRPGVGHDSHRAAIDYRGGALEFRIFDTCYDNPEAFLDNFVVMSNCMKYWTTRYVASGLEQVCSQVQFGNNSGYELKRFYNTVVHIDLLDKGLAKLKPSYYTITEIKRQRKFDISRSKLQNERSEIEKQAGVEYKEYMERFNWRLLANKNYYMGDYIERRTQNNAELANLTRLTAEAEKEAEKLLAQDRSRLLPLTDYIKDKVRQYEGRSAGEFTLRAS